MRGTSQRLAPVLRYQIWQNGYHPIELSTPSMVNQKINYIHDNLVRAGFVSQPEGYKYSSGRSYSRIGKSVLEIEYL
jgi:hypothetical protein